MTEKKHIICVGNTTLDRVWQVTSLPNAGDKYRAHGLLELGGGMAANAAVAVARLGAPARYWGRAGDDAEGSIIKREMVGYGVDVTNLRLFPQARSSISAIFVADDGERMIVNFPGSGIPDQAEWLPLEQVRDAAAVLADIRWSEGAHAAFTEARRCGVPTVLDGEIGHRTSFISLLPLVDHAIFSVSGLRSFASSYMTLPESGFDELAALEHARALGCRIAAVTRGEQGTLWIDETGAHQQAAFPVKVVDTTGAGDVFHGAYGVALAEGQDVRAAMRFASAVAALKCTRAGGRAGIPTHQEVALFLEQHP